MVLDSKVAGNHHWGRFTDETPARVRTSTCEIQDTEATVISM